MLIVCIIAAIFCALQSVRSVSLLIASLWLGGVSVATAIALYLVGAREIAVIELTVSAGLVMVLLVFAITVLGDPTPQMSKIHLGYLLMVGSIAIGLIILSLPELPNLTVDVADQLAVTLWHERSLDILLQIALLFSGALAVLRLLRQPVDEGIVKAAAETEAATTGEITFEISEPEINLEEERV